jgi:hypothetical protein
MSHHHSRKHSRAHRRDTAAGRLARSGAVAQGRRGGRSNMRLLPVVPGQPVDDDVDPRALLAELARLVEFERRSSIG